MGSEVRHPPSVDWFCAASRALDRIHGPRFCGHELNNAFLEHLGAVEAAYKALPPVPKKPSKRKEGR